MYKLRNQIEQVREEMEKLALVEGFSSPNTIKKSIELDELIYKYQQTKQCKKVIVGSY
ncbi:Spo0E family sporulation regulatory protein-aspartic acid phosphatase [Niallia circulans]|uniref:aspartyl-phosphate phosphatase Spo0E family protein n=1 Tax=Niallia circulans TaxID=1397 RepID=UPI000F451F82|nr:aspartyl-phosphate phosphatase Spo0E family protein [Niallia circulans]AYV68205.1 Spo0E family sporulation regulatory protein-aspartic acid phosphatase [Niallia circulans]AYV73399.1 Spo0E family sporulation regulatory protein-aspartic acid phosphatase [Niallia circulans]